MKKILLPALAVIGLLLAGCGGAAFDMARQSDPERVLTGSVAYAAEAPLPANALVRVRIIDNAKPDLPVVLGEQEIKAPGASPVAFRIEYRAEDALLRRGLNVEARISIGGKVHFYNVNAYAITLNSASGPLRIEVNRTTR